MTSAEPAGQWVKSSQSFANGNCVEMRASPGGRVDVRNSRRPDGQVLSFTRDEIAAFLDGAKRGEFDQFGAE